MSAGHLSREFRRAYGESPYSYLMTRRIERRWRCCVEATSALPTSARGRCSSLAPSALASPSSSACRPAPIGVRRRARRRGCRRASQTGHETDQDREASGSRALRRVKPWTSAFTRASSPKTTRDAAKAFYRDTLGCRSPQPKGRVQRDGMDHGGPRRPARHEHRFCIRRPAAPGLTDDERRTIAEMMAKGHLRQPPSRHQGSRRHLRQVQASGAEVMQSD